MGIGESICPHGTTTVAIGAYSVQETIGARFILSQPRLVYLAREPADGVVYRDRSIRAWPLGHIFLFYPFGPNDVLSECRIDDGFWTQTDIATYCSRIVQVGAAITEFVIADARNLQSADGASVGLFDPIPRLACRQQSWAASPCRPRMGRS